MKEKFAEIWKNKTQILEGIKNRLIRDEFVEDVSRHRMEVCDTCDAKDTKGKECVVPGTQPCCMLCGCSLSFKTRSLSSECPAHKWYAVITEEEEDQLDK
jgi:hypothetical protein